MFKYALIIFLASCAPATPSPTEVKPFVVTQDIESCSVDKDTPWCVSACKQAEYAWCVK